MVRDPATRSLCRVKPLTPAAEFTVRTLRFNSRNALRDYWRELERQEEKVTARIQRIEALLGDLDRHVKREGTSEEIESLRDDFLEQRHKYDENLKAVRAMRPFPAE
jgi:hypothetical protein